MHINNFSFFSIFFFNSEESCSSYRILIFEILSEQKNSQPGTFVKDIFWSDDFLTTWFVVSPLKKRFLFFQTMCKRMSTGGKNLQLLKHSYKKKLRRGSGSCRPKRHGRNRSRNNCWYMSSSKITLYHTIAVSFLVALLLKEKENGKMCEPSQY